MDEFVDALRESAVDDALESDSRLGGSGGTAGMEVGL